MAEFTVHCLIMIDHKMCKLKVEVGRGRGLWLSGMYY